MGRLRRSRVHKNNREIQRQARTRARTKDLDQIHEALKKGTAVGDRGNAELPGSGNFYCELCDRYFVEESVLEKHKKGGPHKRR